MGRAKEKVLALLLLLEKHMGGKERMPKKRVSILLENISTAYGNTTLRGAARCLTNVMLGSS